MIVNGYELKPKAILSWANLSNVNLVEAKLEGAIMSRK